MNIHPSKTVRYASLLSPTKMWVGMLLACAAWLLHVTPLPAPLWSDQADLGHGICIELAPVVSAAQQHQADANATMQMAGHEHHHNGVHGSDHGMALAMPSDPHYAAAAISAHSHVDATTTDSADTGSGHHSSCDICAAMSAVIVPVGIILTAALFVESAPILAALRHPQVASNAAAYLRPFSRAPPQP